MRPKLSCYGGHIVGICLLFYIVKAQAFTCDKHSVKGTLKCESWECCTPQLNNVIKADITGHNNLCVLGKWYSIEDKLPGQKCVYLSFLCKVELSYCYTEEIISTTETPHTLPPKVFTDSRSTPTVDIKHAADSTINTLNREDRTKSSTQTSFKDGVIIGVPVAAVFLVFILVSIFLFVRYQRKRRKPSSISPFDTVVRFSNVEYEQTRHYENTRESYDRISSTTLVKNESALFENAGVYKSEPVEVSDYANVPCACLMEDGDRDHRNPVELDEAYDHTNNTDDNNIYDSTYQKSIFFVDNYSKTTPFHDRKDDTYECI
ncbi:hypothetical protein ACJMK2_009845 [Sinanodonta woodiana]|uniref:Uncharacterized protein n=1 Tax=Sinanodonta woodiana TaxID=1069815 RepID=A0ABD3VER8_SINWO